MKERQKKQKLKRIAEIFSTFIHAPEKFDALFAAVHKDNKLSKALVEEIELHDRRLSDHDQKISDIENADPDFIKQVLSGIRQDYEGMMGLNRSLSSCPTVWGDPAKLHISPNASVHTCFFNTNSGNITIGAFTFSGSHVSILAGSHDPRLRGFLRRDAEYPEGYDITIGEGVWLASGCTVLGPCTIGNNAIIAAGAVVVPGTNVPPDTLYGGVPAHLIRKLDTSEETEREAISDALDRNRGFLFVSGWSQKLPDYLPVPAHKLLDDEALVLTDQIKAKLCFRLIDVYIGSESSVVLSVASADEEKEIVLDGEQGEIILEWRGTPGITTALHFRKKSGDRDIFLSLLPV